MKLKRRCLLRLTIIASLLLAMMPPFFFRVGEYSPVYPVYATTACGFNGAASGTDSGYADLVAGVNACVPAVDSTVASCTISVALGIAGNIACAVYDLGTGSSPLVAPALCTSSGQAVITGLNTLLLSGCGTLTSGHRYAIAFSTDNSAVTFDRDGDQAASGCIGADPMVSFSKTHTYGTWPTAGDGAWDNLSVCNLRMWLDLGGSSSTKVGSMLMMFQMLGLILILFTARLIPGLKKDISTSSVRNLEFVSKIMSRRRQ